MGRLARHRELDESKRGHVEWPTKASSGHDEKPDRIQERHADASVDVRNRYAAIFMARFACNPPMSLISSIVDFVAQQFHDLQELFTVGGQCPDTNYLFMGQSGQPNLHASRTEKAIYQGILSIEASTRSRHFYSCSH